MHYVTTPLVLVWMYRWHGRHYRTARTALAISTMLSLIVFWRCPPHRRGCCSGANVPDALFQVRHWGWWGGDGSVPRGLGGLTNQFAAMPSLHVGWALWCGVLLWRYDSHRRAAGARRRLPLRHRVRRARHRQPLPARRARRRAS